MARGPRRDGRARSAGGAALYRRRLRRAPPGDPRRSRRPRRRRVRAAAGDLAGAGGRRRCAPDGAGPAALPAVARSLLPRHRRVGVPAVRPARQGDPPHLRRVRVLRAAPVGTVRNRLRRSGRPGHVSRVRLGAVGFRRGLGDRRRRVGGGGGAVAAVSDDLHGPAPPAGPRGNRPGRRQGAVRGRAPAGADRGYRRSGGRARQAGTGRAGARGARSPGAASARRRALDRRAVDDRPVPRGHLLRARRPRRLPRRSPPPGLGGRGRHRDRRHDRDALERHRVPSRGRVHRAG